jgi:thiol-disulfide isomerase/thioredoxin
MKRMMLIIGMLPYSIMAQSDLNGIWRQKESNITKGPYYSNALPFLLKIEQGSGAIFFEATMDLGEKDTVVTDSIMLGETAVNKSITPLGRKKIVSFQKAVRKIEGDSSIYWLKQTEIFTKEDETNLKSVNKEIFTVFPDGKTLTIRREYDGDDAPNGNEDFVTEGTYEKLTPEQLTKETATGNGVNFTEGLDWEQIKSKAKLENKYIFVDCYATWCVPCKKMDKFVYPLNMVGDTMNDRFVSVKVQMDSTKRDEANIKLLYPLARKLEQDYDISALPTYLFFSPDGKIVHKAIGEQDVRKFIDLVTRAREPEYQLYTLLNKAKAKRLPLNEYPALAMKFKDEFDEKEMASTIARIYINDYLNKLNEIDLLQKQHLDFAGNFISAIKSSDKLLKLSLTKPALVDSIKEYEGGGWAEHLVNRTLIREYVQPIFREAEKTAKEPDWKKLKQQISKKYGTDLATTYELDAKVDWYEKKKNWKLFLHYLRPHLARHDLRKMRGDHLHYCAWYVFKYSNDPALMRDAIRWVDIMMEKWPENIRWILLDTKSCLLYKLGQRQDGIAIMQGLTKAFPQFNYTFQPRLNSMMKGEAIWLTFE